jgi:hypothetical protein
MRLFRILRDPEGGESAGTVMAEAGSQSPDVEGQQAPAEGSQTQETRETQAKPPVNKGKLLAEVLKKTEKKGYTPTDEELDVLEEHWDGKLQPENGEAPDPKADQEKGERPESKPEPKPKPAGADALTSELQKELGAKSVEEILPKLRDLKKLTGSRDAQAAARFERELAQERDAGKAERQLWEDVKKGVPTAIEYLERQVATARQRFNLPAGSQGKPQGGPQAKPFIDPSKFTFPEEAEAINTVLGGQFGEMRQMISQQAEIIRRLEQKDQKREQDHILSSASMAQLDETMAVAALIPELKDVPGLRDKVSKWIQDPNAEIPELKVIDELFDIANQNKTNLRIAWDSLEAKRLRDQIAKAKDAGVQEAYKHKPNSSLSDLQGRGGIPYKNYSDAELRRMESDPYLIPDEWLDKDGNLDEKKMPERARKLLLAAEERA